MKHGTRTSYNLYRCRCKRCRAANAAYVTEWAAKKKLTVRQKIHRACAASVGLHLTPDEVRELSMADGALHAMEIIKGARQ